MNAKRFLPLLCLAASFSSAASVGVSVNGVDVSARSGAGWAWNPATSNLVLSAAGPYVLAGTDELGKVAVVVRPPAGTTAEITLSNLALASSAAAPFALETNATVRLLLDGTNSLTSARSGRPALLVPADASLVVSNATDGLPFLTAAGGAEAAAIGGASGGAVGSIEIAGGRVVASATGYGASGIGAGNGGKGGSVTISGGVVDAVGGNPGAGLGGGSGGRGPSVAISGGTVVARGRNTIDAGPTFGSVATNEQQNVLVTGGSFHALAGRIAPAPSNGTERVWCVTVPELEPQAPATGPEGLPAGYGLRDLVADDGGRIYLWLPNGDYAFSVGETNYVATVAGANTVATLVEEPPPPPPPPPAPDPVGVFVDGVDVSALSGDGWAYDPAASNLVLSAAGPCVLSGSNVLGEVAVVVRPAAGETAVVTVSNLVLASSAAAPFALETNATVRLLLDGSNSLSSARSGRPALLVPADASLVVTNAPSILPPYCESVLLAEGGSGAAAIGGASGGAAGSIEIAGGRVVARAVGYGASGIGAGSGGKGGSVTVSGGLVDAAGGNPGTGLGGGSGGRGPSVSISGGTVVAKGNGSSVDVGPTFTPVATNAPQTVLVTGGSLHPFDLQHATVQPAPSNGTERVWCVTVTNLPPDTLVEGLAGLPDGYGTRDLVADSEGRLYLWLPDGGHELSLGDDRWTAAVAGRNVVAAYRSVAKPESVAVESVAVAEDAVTIVVSVVPAEWLSGHAAVLRVRAADALPMPAPEDAPGDYLDPATVGVDADPDAGTAVLTVPATGSATRFFRVEVP